MEGEEERGVISLYSGIDDFWVGVKKRIGDDGIEEKY